MVFEEDTVDFSKMTELMGPGMVDRELRQAMHLCWMSLPAERRTIDDLAKEMHRLLARAIENLREHERLRKPE